jgi:hypothetical protein
MKNLTKAFPNKLIITQLEWEIINHTLNQIISKAKLDLNYYDELLDIISLFLIKTIETDEMGLMERYENQSHLYYSIIREATEMEYYEICSKLQKLIEYEIIIHQEYITQLDIEQDDKDEIQELFNYTNKIYKPIIK